MIGTANPNIILRACVHLQGIDFRPSLEFVGFVYILGVNGIQDWRTAGRLEIFGWGDDFELPAGRTGIWLRTCYRRIIFSEKERPWISQSLNRYPKRWMGSKHF